MWFIRTFIDTFDRTNILDESGFIKHFIFPHYFENENIEKYGLEVIKTCWSEIKKNTQVYEV